MTEGVRRRMAEGVRRRMTEGVRRRMTEGGAPQDDRGGAPQDDRRGGVRVLDGGAQLSMLRNPAQSRRISPRPIRLRVQELERSYDSRALRVSAVWIAADVAS